MIVKLQWTESMFVRGGVEYVEKLVNCENDGAFEVMEEAEEPMHEITPHEVGNVTVCKVVDQLRSLCMK